MVSILTKKDASSTMLERLRLSIVKDKIEACRYAASELAALIRQKQQRNEMAVLGLATGESPVEVYRELIRLHHEDGLSFKNVITFNLDEYYPMQKNSALSYHHFMRNHLFDHIDIPEESINIPDGELPIEKVEDFCRYYEEKIDACGGLDVQLLGIGRTGHIGFNEPGSHRESVTRLVKLHPITIMDATREFLREDLVPRRAITMGIKSISKARKVFLLAWGEKKAPIVREAVEGPVSEDIPATFLQNHENVEVLADEDAASDLTRVRTPWVVSVVNWTDSLAKSAVIWLSQKLSIPILKLTEEDYRKNGLNDLLAYAGDALKLNVKIFDALQHTITGWPGGKPGTDDTDRPERASPARKRVIIFSPHPDDDVISMGGTYLKLVEQGHDVHVAYQTSGNIAVADDDVIRFVEFARDMNAVVANTSNAANEKYGEILEYSKTNKTDLMDTHLMRTAKGLIRKGEATAAARYVGTPGDHIHFLNMPFYETGMVKKGVIGDGDLDLLKNLLEMVKPHQVFAAGDLRDPHGTHKICFDAIVAALKQLKGESWIEECWLWMYRGAWHEWPLDEIEMAIPLSPSDLQKKRKAIFKHQSQKDTPLFPGNDPREFWQRTEDRNHETARMYDKLGFTEYEAMEAFVRYKF
ncbi:glucosamine-6-phosphate deaminase [Fulvivirga sp. M361]|nr:glucosamine-6-phosphate deaminase [Fulvivirga sp. M361]